MRNLYVAHMSSSPTPQDTGFETAEVERSVRIEAPLDDVWRSLTEPDELSTWLGGEVDLDRPIGPGAAGRLVEDDGAVRHLLVTAHEPGRLVRWHWWRETAEGGEGELSSVEIVLTPDAGATIVRVVEVVARSGASAAASPGFSSADAAMEAIDRRWAGALPALAARLTGLRRATLPR